MKRLPNPLRAIAWMLPLAVLAGMLYSARGDLHPYLQRVLAGQWRVIQAAPFPVTSIEYIYDMGVVDADGDGRLDLYTTNHNYQQAIYLATDGGGFKEVSSAWRLDQSPSMPGIEQTKVPPTVTAPGLYVYWIGDALHLQFQMVEQLAPVTGRAHFYNLVKVVENDGVELRQQASRSGKMPETLLEFSTARSGHLVLYLETRGAPANFRIDAPWARTNTFVGRNAVVPPAYAGILDATAAKAADACASCLEFEMTLLDRHSMAWADLNNDGLLDVFINRGALGGTLRSFPQRVRDQVGDELQVSTGRGRFADRARELGLRKKDCSGRHARWVDFDQDGRLDLFVNCQDRGNVPGGYPKQLYRQRADGGFDDVAAEVGLDLPDHQLVDLVWFDADGDGRIDLFTHEDTGYYLYRRVGERFERTRVHVGPFHRANVPGLTGNTYDYWQFDGKLSVADFDGDGDLDVFVASKRGNVLLVNQGDGRFVSVPPASLGLPVASVSATWVDIDNDGRMDLHIVPEGIYRQNGSGRFERTGLLALPDHKYQAAIVNWFDRDNDGDLDAVVVLQDNATLWRWWERFYKSADVQHKDDRFDWKLDAWRNDFPPAAWLQVKLVGRPGNAQAIGARVTLNSRSGRQARQVGSHEGSYLSQGHYRLYFGLGGDRDPVSLDIVWPDGSKQTVTGVAVNRLVTLVQGN